jgi:GR25 family glycosyltransferase involved in LPS biosynthesis
MAHLDVLRDNKAKYLLVITEKLTITERINDIIKNRKYEEFIPFGKSNNLLELDGYLMSENYAKKLLVHFLQHPIIFPCLDFCQIKQNLNLCKYFTEIPGFKFYSQLDSFGNDKKHLPDKSLEELAEICKRLDCIAFNTLGYLKEKVVDVKDFIYLPNSAKSSEGIYILVSS